ncbi:MAG: aminoacyl-tRNA hydrolase [Bacilli bacterium]|nr:aminoacyl-tRNA hydrolase [Bacilli bacterium]
MKLIVGLGNPGKEYESTRHNIGFMVLDNYLGNVKWSNKFNGLYYETNINGEKYIFLKPLSYMNLSGGVVRQYKDYFDIDVEDILVIQDDLDLPVGKIRLKVNSTAGGHNGIKDIIANLGTDSFARIKVGVSQDRDIDTRDYVLGKFSKEDLKIIVDKFDDINNLIEEFDYNNINELMSKYN